MSSTSVTHAIKNVRSIMDNLQSWPGVEVTFSHEEAFDVYANIRSTGETDMTELANLHNILTSHGFEEVDSHQFGTNEWCYKWNESNY